MKDELDGLLEAVAYDDLELLRGVEARPCLRHCREKAALGSLLRHDQKPNSFFPSPPPTSLFAVKCSFREFTRSGSDVFAVASQHRDRQQLYAAIAHDVHAHFCSQMLFSNIDDGYLEGLLRGLRSGILSSTDYANLCQCESIDGARARACSPAPI
jgi:hypothetical protein